MVTATEAEIILKLAKTRQRRPTTRLRRPTGRGAASRCASCRFSSWRELTSPASAPGLSRAACGWPVWNRGDRFNAPSALLGAVYARPYDITPGELHAAFTGEKGE